MDDKQFGADDFSGLRRRAEKRLTEQSDNPQSTSTREDLQRLVHELSVHQIELEMQKEELLHANENLAISRIELQQGLDRYTDLYDFAPVGYLTLTRDSKIADANLTAVKMLGVERSLLKGERFSRFILEQERQVFKRFMDRVFFGREPESCQVTLSNAGLQDDKSPGQAGLAAALKTVHLDAVVCEDEHSCRVALSDISRQVEVERENALLQDNLAQSQKMDSIGRLAGGIAHDFNNMLAVILGHTELALRKADPLLPIRSDLEAIHKAAKRSAELTHQLLGFARKQTVITKVLDLNSAVESSLKMVRRLIGENIVVDWQQSKEKDYVNMDPAQMDQILINLCINARDAISGEGRIIIRTGRQQVSRVDSIQVPCGMTSGDYVILSVSDNGSGIDKETLQHIFEPFFTTKEQNRGTGLGLSTVYGIVKQNFGCIECTSEPGKGSTFIIYLPRYIDVVPGAAYTKSSECTECGKGEVLIVEDEPDILSFIKCIFESKGYSVHTALKPSEALRIASEESDKIGLLLTDVIMPEMNGSELACKLKTMIPDIKIIFMSGYTADIIAGCGIPDGGVNFVQKPFSIASLIKVVEKVMSNEQ
ncbi:MAG: response regulator [Chlorobiaceae bacterium]|nr:response regulator [Chlorobiaceae bacterium]